MDNIELERDLSEIFFKVRVMPDSTRKQLISMLRQPALPDIPAIEKALADLTRQLDEAKAEIGILDGTHKFLQDVIAQFKDQLAAKDTEIAALKEDKREYMNTIASLQDIANGAKQDGAEIVFLEKENAALLEGLRKLEWIVYDENDPMPWRFCPSCGGLELESKCPPLKAGHKPDCWLGKLLEK